MRLFRKTPEEPKGKETLDSSPADTPTRGNSHSKVHADVEPRGRVPAIAVVLGAVASIGGFMFGYESGQISGKSTLSTLPANRVLIANRLS